MRRPQRMLYAFLPGTTLEQVLPHAWRHAPSPHVITIATALGAFLNRLHGAPPVAAHGDDGAAIERDLDEGAQFAAARLTRLEGHLDARTRNALLARIRDRLPPLRSPTVFGHNDLAAEHVLLDDGGAACAVIDFGDAGPAHWWGDFTGIWMWGGDAALTAALAAYGKTLSGLERAYMTRHATLAAISDCDDHLYRVDPANAARGRADDWADVVQPYLQRWL